jgi:uncharacterized membrane protein
MQALRKPEPFSLLQSPRRLMRATMIFMKSPSKFFLGFALGCWLATGMAIVSRMQLVFDYATMSLAPPAYEILAGSFGAIAAVAILGLAIAGPLFFESRPKIKVHTQVASNHRPVVLACFLAASAPLALLLLRLMGAGVPPPGWWELAWFAGWTGLAVRFTLANTSVPSADHPSLWRFVLSVAVVGCGIWWFIQSCSYFASYQLGFNDFGHFTQRISTTANGAGFLMETPVLPPFWDHFNPGLLLLVPLWSVVPHVELIFAIQAACLAGSAWLLAAIARARGQSSLAACGWGCSWLLVPSLGQMNLAYTYGWHPITLAIPCLLAAYLSLCLGRIPLAILWALVAASFEEGVIVVIACFAATQALRAMRSSGIHNNKVGNNKVGWCAAATLAVVAFVCVYRFSGLAPFQTGRFAKLGNHALEIIASPILRPDAFWGLLFRPRNFAFLCLTLIPFAVGATRNWWWSLLAVTPPFFVLTIWEHMPAQSLAFQYISCLLPVLFAGILEPTNKAESTNARAWGMAAVAWLLSIAIGQMPWSNDSLVDVKAKTYGFESKWLRSETDEDARWVANWIRSIRQKTGSPDIMRLPEWKQLRVLATGRLAAHCVGAGDVETVGQFWQRYDALKGLDPNLASPILRYDILMLDLRESFQQTTDETERIVKEAEKHGWSIQERRYDFAILMR